MCRAINHTFLALIPKWKSADKVDQFRPIALCNVAYKVVTKILATRLRTVLTQIIHPSQAAFVPNRSIIDNYIINHEIMHYMRTTKGKTGVMAIKIDMAQAYDMVEWTVLRHILQLHGFSDKLCCLVSECISTPQFSVLINGAPTGFFPSSRGIRQGDPISPALFTIISDLLSRILAESKRARNLSGIKISCTSPLISHLI